MFALGREFAVAELERVRFVLPDEDDDIRGPLERLMQQVNLVLGRHDNDAYALRANVFIPRGDGLALTYAFNMDGHPDRGMVLKGNQGLTGTCYACRRPYLCILEILREWAISAAHTDPQATQLGMTPHEHLMLPADRTVLINVPIFDPQDSWFLDELPERTRPEADAVWTELPVDRDGAVLGVLNVDGSVPYDDLLLSDDPETALTDVRMKSILALLWACSIDIGRPLSRAFARRV